MARTRITQTAVGRSWPRTSSGQRQAASRDVPWVIFSELSVLALLALYQFGDSRGQLIAVAASGCLVCLALFIGVGRLLPRYYAMRLLIVSYGLQLLALTAVALLGLPLSPVNQPFEANAADAPFTIVLAMLAAPAGALVVALAWWFVSPSSQLAKKIGSQEGIAKQRRVYLVIAAIALLLFWPAALADSGVVGYLVRIAVSALAVAPFLAGVDSQGDRGLATFWSLGLLVNGVIGIVVGSRSMALIPVVLFAAGYISALPKRRRFGVSVCAVIAMVPLIAFAGAAGVVRDRLGRGGLELVTIDHILDVLHELSSELTLGNQQDKEEVTGQGVGRLLAWSNVVVPLMTPETIPYRGFDGFLEEAAQTFRIARISGLTADDFQDLGLGNAQARVYGFTVNSNTAVEFTLAADGWSRGGGLVALLFFVIISLALTFGELCAYRLRRYGTGVATILALPLARAAFFDTNIFPLLATLRGVVIFTLVVAALVVIIEPVRHAAHNVRRRRVASPWGSDKVSYGRGVTVVHPSATDPASR